MKKTLFILIILLTGCIKYPDLDNISIIKNIGISYQDNHYTLYAKVYDEIKKNNKPTTKIIKTDGKTIEDAFKNIKLLSNKEVYFSHIDLLVLDTNLNNDNYQEIINYSLTNNLRNDFKCIFSTNIITLFNNSEDDEIENYLNTNKVTKKIINTSFDEIISNYLNNKTFVLSMITYNKEVKYQGNYQYYNNHVERITNEKN